MNKNNTVTGNKYKQIPTKILRFFRVATFFYDWTGILVSEISQMNPVKNLFSHLLHICLDNVEIFSSEFVVTGQAH